MEDPRQLAFIFPVEVTDQLSEEEKAQFVGAIFNFVNEATNGDGSVGKEEVDLLLMYITSQTTMSAIIEGMADLIPHDLAKKVVKYAYDQLLGWANSKGFGIDGLAVMEPIKVKSTESSETGALEVTGTTFETPTNETPTEEENGKKRKLDETNGQAPDSRNPLSTADMRERRKKRKEDQREKEEKHREVKKKSYDLARMYQMFTESSFKGDFLQYQEFLKGNTPKLKPKTKFPSHKELAEKKAKMTWTAAKQGPPETRLEMALPTRSGTSFPARGRGRGRGRGGFQNVTWSRTDSELKTDPVEDPVEVEIEAEAENGGPSEDATATEGEGTTSETPNTNAVWGAAQSSGLHSGFRGRGRGRGRARGSRGGGYRGRARGRGRGRARGRGAFGSSNKTWVRPGSESTETLSQSLPKTP